jgi:hypothetical protein
MQSYSSRATSPRKRLRLDPDLDGDDVEAETAADVLGFTSTPLDTGC